MLKFCFFWRITNQIAFFQYPCLFYCFCAGDKKCCIYNILYFYATFAVWYFMYRYREMETMYYYIWLYIFVLILPQSFKTPIYFPPLELSLPGIFSFLGKNLVLQTMSLSSILLHVCYFKPLLDMNLSTDMPRGFDWNSYMLLWIYLMKNLELTRYHPVRLV